MKREILYRGKRVDNGEWVEGDRVEQNNPEYHDYIITEFAADVDNRHIDILTCDIYEVDPSTVGQYTGMTDKNGKRIFEGDILALSLVSVCNNCAVEWYDGGFCYRDAKKRYYEVLVQDDAALLEVVGNIHDNPELMNSEGTARNGR